MARRVGALTISVEDAGAVLGISRGGAYEAVKSGDIPSIRIGRRLLVPRRAFIERFNLDEDDLARAVEAAAAA